MYANFCYVNLTGHTHDAVPEALKIGNTLVTSSGSHGKYLGRIDLEVSNDRISDYSSSLIPVFSDVITPDKTKSEKLDQVRAPYEKELQRVIGKTNGILYRRGNFNGIWDDLICQGRIEERDAELSFSPDFWWGSINFPGQNITIDGLYNQTAMSYSAVYRLEFTGQRIKEILEDVYDNLLNPDPFFSNAVIWYESVVWVTPALQKR